MIARCDSIGTNTWAGTNTFNSGVFFNSAVTFTGTPINFNSNQINLGDNNATDNVFVLATMKMFGDFNANTYDMYNIDRLKFGTTAGSGSALAATDTGIEAVYSGGNSYGMKSVVPANNVYQMFIGSSEKVTIATSSIVLNNPVTIGGYVAIGDNYMEYGDMTSANVGTTPANKRRVFSNSANNDELSVKKSDGSVVSLEASGSGASLSANNNFTGINSFTNAGGSFTVSTPTVSLGTGSGNINIFGNITMSNYKITGLGTPTATTDAATKAYVDANAGGGGVSLGGTNTWTGQQTFSNQNTIIQNDLTVYDNVTIQDDLQVYDDVTLGSSISDDIDINGRVEIGNSYTAYIQSPPALSVGYITIKVGGSSRNILCF
jgi:hypothetical protein